MKKIIALVLSIAMLLTFAAAAAEAPEKESMGVLKVNKAFDIKYKPLGDDYTISIYTQNDMTIIANIQTLTHPELPRMGLVIAFNDEWAETERLNDVSAEDMEAIKSSFYVEYEAPEFEIRDTAFGTNLLVVKPGNGEAIIYTIYRGHEIEMRMTPGAEATEITDADIDRVVGFLSDMDFDPVDD